MGFVPDAKFPGQYFPLADPETVTGWIAATQTTYTTVDVSSHVPANATHAHVRIRTRASSGTPQPRLRRVGSSADTDGHTVQEAGSTSHVWTNDTLIELDGSYEFEAKFVASFTSSTNQCSVIGYVI